MRLPTRLALAAFASGAAGLGYAYAESQWFVLRHASVAVLPPGMPPLRVLHVTDLHLTPNQKRKHDWLRGLAALEPDLVISTGDNLAALDAVPSVLSAYGDLLDVPGVFVFGSNDYYAPTLKNPIDYFLSPDKRTINSPPLPWRDLRDGFNAAGWVDLSNRRDTLKVGDVTLAFAGVDDPHLKYDDLAAVLGPADSSADLRIGVTHAPYLRVLDQYAADGYDITMAGHTHGGQVCLPIKGALVTNCDLETARAKGLHRHPADSQPGDPESSWLHVSAGLGTSPYSQIRFCCRPEATLLTLDPIS
ncbi:MAG TPA: metallophosphoesterase [Nocardioidaceae bacterium]|nr:metallophosphoesterase [Nocardioidaceae bacterium]